MAKFKGILLTVAVVAAAGIAYVTFGDRIDPKEGIEGAIGAAEKHQNEKTRYYSELSKTMDADKIATIGKIAAKFESAPGEAEKMLREQGWSKDEFDKMVKAIRAKEDLNKMFEAARKKASQL